jgi:hypothetical protein
MFMDLVKRFNLLVVVIPHQEFAFDDASPLEFALWNTDGQTCHDGSVDANAIGSGVPTTLGEDLDFGAGSFYTDMDLTILAIVFLFDAHGSPSRQLAVVSDTSGFITGGQTYHDAGSRLEVVRCRLSQNAFNMFSGPYQHLLDCGVS